jgi:tetratricopeptide (TPR) repeat protein
MRTLLSGLLAVFVVVAPAIAADHDAAAASYRQGNALFDHFQFADAAAAYGRAIDQDPQFKEPYFNLALADEMVDRQKAVNDWRKFVEVGGDGGDYVDQVGQANARIELLGKMPIYADSLQPSHYVTAAGDYYGQVAEDSESRLWKTFPLMVSMGECLPPIGHRACARRSKFGRACYRWN